MFREIAPSEWKVAHEVEITTTEDGFCLADTKDLSWHLITTSSSDYVNRRVRLRIVASPMDDGNTWLYINQWGAYDVAFVSRDGASRRGVCDDIVVERDGDDRFRIDVTYYLTKGAILLGTATEPGYGEYRGTGRPQWKIHSVEVEIEANHDTPVGLEDRLVLVDVGAAEGIDPMWASELSHMHCVLFEPNPPEAALLREELKALPSGQVIEAALYECKGPRTLNITRFDRCSSLLEPDEEQLSRYKVAPCFEVVRRIEVQCVRYDEIPGVPAPDMIKIDVQGAEYEVLKGFGGYLDTVIGVEVESHLYPIYKGQKLLGDLVALLSQHGLRLRNISPQPNFDRDLTEVNAFFTREGDLPAKQSLKRDLIHRKLELSEKSSGEELATKYAGG